MAKIGYGASSVVWLVIDFKAKDFKVLKVFLNGFFVTDVEHEVSFQASLLFVKKGRKSEIEELFNFFQ